MTDPEPREPEGPRDHRDPRRAEDPRDKRDPRKAGDPRDPRDPLLVSDALDERIVAIRRERVFPRWPMVVGFVIVTALLIVLLLRVQLVIDDLRSDIEDNVIPTTTIEE